MLVISFDTHSHQCLVSISRNGSLIASYATYVPHQHDKLLAEYTRRILTDFDVSIDEIEAISIVSGPGSFTGLRIGFALVKGLAIEKKIRLIKVPTNHIFAYQSIEFAKILNKNKIVSIIPGSSEKYYLQEFDLNSNPLSKILTIEQRNINFDENVLYVGNFELNNYEEHLKLKLNFIHPKPLVELSFDMIQKNKFTVIQDFEPDYYFDFVPVSKK